MTVIRVGGQNFVIKILKRFGGRKANGSKVGLKNSLDEREVAGAGCPGADAAVGDDDLVDDPNAVADAVPAGHSGRGRGLGGAVATPPPLCAHPPSSANDKTSMKWYSKVFRK